MRLYDDPCSGNGYKVRLILALLGRNTITSRSISTRPRPGRPSSWPKIPMAGYRCWSWTTGSIWPSPTRSSSIWRTVRRFFRKTGWRMRRCCNGCSSSSTATSPISRRCGSGCTSMGSRLTPLQEMELPGRMAKGYAALGVMEQRLAHHPNSSSPTYTASPTSRSMPTPTSPMKAASTCRDIRR